MKNGGLKKKLLMLVLPLLVLVVMIIMVINFTSTKNIMTDYIPMGQMGMVNDVASNMAAISEQQSASTEEISATIDNLTRNAQQVAMESGQVEACSELLNGSSVSLEEYMSKFMIR